MHEITGRTIAFVVLVIGVVTVSLSIAKCEYDETKLYIEKGYCKYRTDGLVIWKKCEEK